MLLIKRIFLNPIFLWILVVTLFLFIYLKENVTDPFQIALVNTDKSSSNLNQYLGKKPILLDFWASWCSHCKNQIAVLNQLMIKHPEITIIGIQVDNDEMGHIDKTIKYVNLLAKNNGNLLMRQFGNYIGIVPYLLFLSPDGKKVTSIIGETNLNQLEQTLFKKQINLYAARN